MAKMVLTNAFVSVDGNDISDHVAQVTVNYSADMQDSTAMGGTTHTRLGGLKDWSVELELFQDFASSEVDSILFPLVGSTFTVLVRPDAGSQTSTNPTFSGTGILESYKPVAGSVGDILKTPVVIQAAGALSRLAT